MEIVVHHYLYPPHDPKLGLNKYNNLAITLKQNMLGHTIFLGIKIILYFFQHIRISRSWVESGGERSITGELLPWLHHGPRASQLSSSG
jgi:hypothetical protein